MRLLKSKFPGFFPENDCIIRQLIQQDLSGLLIKIF